MSDAQAFGDNMYERDTAQYSELPRNGVKSVSMNGDASGQQGEAAAGDGNVQNLDPVLAGVRTVFTDVVARLDRVYHGLAERQIAIERREGAVRESERVAAQALSDARGEAGETVQKAQRDAGETLEAARREAALTMENAQRE